MVRTLRTTSGDLSRSSFQYASKSFTVRIVTGPVTTIVFFTKLTPWPVFAERISLDTPSFTIHFADLVQRMIPVFCAQDIRLCFAPFFLPFIGSDRHPSPAFIVNPARKPDPAPLDAIKQTASPRCNPGRYPSVSFIASGAGFPAKADFHKAGNGAGRN
jgi:hypothetical protein